MARLPKPQQEKSCGDNHGDRHKERRRIHRGSNRQGSEAHMGQAVADHGIALENQCDAEHRCTQGDQRPHQERPHHKWIGKHFDN